MNSTDTGFFSQIFYMIDRVALVLGFTNVTSLFLAIALFSLVVGFTAAAVISLRKAQLRRKQEILKVVEEVQSEALQLEEETIAKEVVLPRKEPVVAADWGLALNKTRHGFMARLKDFFSKTKISGEDFQKLEEILFTADIGTKTAQKLLDRLQDRVSSDAGDASLETILKEEMLKILDRPKSHSNGLHPRVMMIVGVNGAGKTTSIGKLGALLSREGKKVLFGAGDTYRAAAVQQLMIWGERAGAEVVRGEEKADSASVLFNAVAKGKSVAADVILCDTAGRLHTKVELMDELKKVHRVLGKAEPGSPHDVLLVIDATMGQNAIAQAREFAEATPLTGIILTKLDGTAKGGVALGIVSELGIPIRYVGVGEKTEDLREFEAKEFVDALFG